MADYGGGGSGGGGTGYSASGSSSSGNEQQFRFDKQFGEINASTGLQLPVWAWPLIILGFFGAVIVALIIFWKH